MTPPTLILIGIVIVVIIAIIVIAAWITNDLFKAQEPPMMD